MIDMSLGDTQLILAECRKQRATREQTAYILATAYWETARTMKPVREAFWLSEEWRRANLRYYPFYGRGYVQLTWEFNYDFASDIVGVDLVKFPDKAMEPKIAAVILVRGMLEGWFTKKALPTYVNAQKVDFEGARRVVNGTDKAVAIANIARDYLAVLPKSPLAGPTGLGALIAQLFAALFGRKK